MPAPLRFRTPVASCAAFLAVVLYGGAPVSASAQAPAPDTSAKAVVAAAVDYIEQYTGQLAFLVADETYMQETFASEGVRTGSRMIKGELFLTFLKADRAWIAVHDPAEVDGQAVADRRALQTLLLRGATMSVVADVARHNARFNIGRIDRDFNEPTLALLVLDRSRVNNFTFRQKGVEARGGAALVTVEFSERDRATIVRSRSGSPIPSRGELLIEAGTGRVLATHITFKDGPITAALSTTYAPDPRLNLLVPVSFFERYEGMPQGMREINTGRATYSNFRRYEVLGRIKTGSETEVAEPPAPPPAAAPPAVPAAAEAPAPQDDRAILPVRTSGALPAYPPDLLRQGAGGVVIVTTTIDQTGAVTAARAERSIPALGAVASAAVRQWRYAPPMRDGRPTPITVPLRFYFDASTGRVDEVRALQPNAPGPRKTRDVPATAPPERAGRTGQVVMEIVVDRTGKVVHIDVVRATSGFEGAARTAVSQWEYEPFLVDGAPVPFSRTVTVLFSGR